MKYWQVERDDPSLKEVLLLFVCLFVFLGLHPQRMKFLARSQIGSFRPMPKPQQHEFQATSVTYTTAYGKIGSLTQ